VLLFGSYSGSYSPCSFLEPTAPVNLFSLANHIQTPRLWKLFTHLVNPVNQDHHHISTFAVTRIFVRFKL
jgi:hypothetical protein